MTDPDAPGLPDFRRLPIPEAIRWLAENGEPADPRDDVDTASLERRFPHLRGVEADDAAVDGPHGSVPVRRYRKPGRAARTALVWVHGGGFIGGSLDMPESNWVAREIAARGIPVLAVDYTKCLGQAHFPVPSDDVLAAWDAAPQLLGLPAERLVIGGASAGGNLVTGVVARLRDGAAGAMPEGLVPVYPALHPDGAAPGGTVDPASPGGQLSLNFAGSAEALADPHAFPGLGSGAGYPPILVVVCEEDALRPSGEAFARLVRQAGGEIDVHLETGAAHGHIDHPGDAGALRTIDAIADWIRER
ncbi:alpha/beta hydrolase [Microbacterium gilvum]|uniref:Alpha/beta hydrolase n=1 Tax=Microbacterium gilvum TaxID=1336204 RepID=A0ABP9AL61_9MICO